MLCSAATSLGVYDSNGDGHLSEADFGNVITLLISRMSLLHPQERMTGAWTKPKEDTAEPARTERLIAHPFVLLRSRAADCQDSIALCMLPKSSGKFLIGLCVQWGAMLVQVTRLLTWLACLL